MEIITGGKQWYANECRGGVVICVCTTKTARVEVSICMRGTVGVSAILSTYYDKIVLSPTVQKS